MRTLALVLLAAAAGIAVGVWWADRWIARTVADMDWGVEVEDDDESYPTR